MSIQPASAEQPALFAVDVLAPPPDLAPSAPLPVVAAPRVEVRRSSRRRRTVSARREGDTIVVSLPARTTRADEERWVAEMVERVLASERKSRPTDTELTERAVQLSARYLGGRATPASVRWVDNMASRWGSCTPIDGTIRLSRRLVGMPAYVIDYVLLHELAHLLVPGHGPAFWRELAGYERLERAKGFLEGVDLAGGQSEAR
ncbi:MAG: M48 family metallopeptidase [Frankiaceae bacterium]|nr:M48 family metallopeptidase [Frankiaceae bacterium]MBV9872199.1 M48 family metallopeptidase [Frankiaceae bacterium]